MPRLERQSAPLPKRQARLSGSMGCQKDTGLRMYNLIKSDPYRKLVEQRKAELKSLIDHGATDAAIGAELGMTVSRVKYWIREWNLGRRKHIIATGRFR